MQKLETFYHSVGFNIVKLDSILRNGLMSLENAKKENKLITSKINKKPAKRAKH